MQGLSKLALSALVLAGCSDSLFGEKSQDRSNSLSGARLTVTLGGDNDVVGFHFQVDAVACEADAEFAEFSYSANVALDDTAFPGRIEFLEEKPLDSDSSHMGADFFVALDPGCYIVTASPASEIRGDEWTPSEDCSTAVSDPLDVVGGYTTETILLSQCEGDLVGAVDALVVLNTPPVVIPNVENKFNNQCEPVEVCAQGWDPDDDPIEFAFENLSSTPFFSMELSDLALIGYEDGHRLWEQCATIVSQDIADYTVEIRAYDLAYDEHGAEIRIEDYIGEDSHGWIQIPIHTGWTQSDACIEEDGSITSTSGSYEDVECDPAVCMIVSDETFYCSGDYDVDADIVGLICDGADLLTDVLYEACDPA